MNIPLLVAHRGFMENYPENSLRGLEAALEEGAPYIEFDIQSTADLELMVFHDPDLQRTTGTEGSLFELTYPELRQISAHEPDRFGERFNTTAIIRLAEICPLLKRYPGARALAEIKSATLERFGVQPVMQRLLEVLEPVADRCTIIGYDAEALAYARSKKGFSIGWVIASYDQQERHGAEQLQPDLMIGEVGMFSPGERPWPGPWNWMLYDITDPALALAYAGNGVDLIETRDIATMYQDPQLASRRLPVQHRRSD